MTFVVNGVVTGTFAARLPDGDGRTLVTSLRAKGDHIPVLMLTARDGLEDKVAGLASGAAA